MFELVREADLLVRVRQVADPEVVLKRVAHAQARPALQQDAEDAVPLADLLAGHPGASVGTDRVLKSPPASTNRANSCSRSIVSCGLSSTPPRFRGAGSCARAPPRFKRPRRC